MKDVTLLVSGFVIWSGAFLLIYALHATGCALGVRAEVLRALLILAFAVFVSAGFVPLWLAIRRRRGLLGQSAVIATVAALVATVLTFSTVLWLGLC
ncbi:hypothetical protein [Falsirhodobacter deserti]|uniref:hypothetical protein n=1 Tax=Falsirhodobacter deserti TaxID=1365611 RepID=UPI000FE403F2|nr:hypothetical protein [Falsirhodobacter deserti]